MIKILFICAHNDARTIMAEAFLNHLGSHIFQAESAGLEKGVQDPLVTGVMNEIDIDTRDIPSRDIFELFTMGRHYQGVITLCDESAREESPIFPGISKRLTWSFPDPAGFKGSPEGIWQQTRMLRDDIKNKVLHFVEEAGHLSYWVNDRRTMAAKQE